MNPFTQPDNRPHMLKQAVIRKEDGKYKLLTKDGKRVLGTHDTRQGAIKQEYAIEKSQERREKKATVSGNDPDNTITSSQRFDHGPDQPALPAKDFKTIKVQPLTPQERQDLFQTEIRTPRPDEMKSTAQSSGPLFDVWGEHLWNAENASKEGYDPTTGQWKTYWDEHEKGKGSWAVGPGINVPEEGVYTQEQVDQLHRQAMQDHWDKARNYYEGFDELTPAQQHFLAGGKYLGVKHPSFYGAARAGKPVDQHMTYKNDRRERLEQQLVQRIREMFQHKLQP